MRTDRVELLTPIVPSYISPPDQLEGDVPIVQLPPLCGLKILIIEVPLGGDASVIHEAGQEHRASTFCHCGVGGSDRGLSHWLCGGNGVGVTRGAGAWAHFFLRHLSPPQSQCSADCTRGDQGTV